VGQREDKKMVNISVNEIHFPSVKATAAFGSHLSSILHHDAGIKRQHTENQSG
jgi:hypothetical protein